jgi:hypothetical protein
MQSYLKLKVDKNKVCISMGLSEDRNCGDEIISWKQTCRLLRIVFCVAHRPCLKVGPKNGKDFKIALPQERYLAATTKSSIRPKMESF